MKTKILKTALLFGTAIILLSFDLPSDWFKAGNSPKSYEMGIDKGVGKDSKNAGTIKSIETNIKGFGTLMQECHADKYLGKRVKMTGYVKSENVIDWAGLWLRIDKANSTEHLALDNMQDRAIKGTTEWTKYEIVLDVPENASLLAYGALLNGTGQIWFDNISFEIVGDSEKTSAPIKKDRIPVEPRNLGFEK